MIELRDELTRLYVKVGTHSKKRNFSGATSFKRFPKTWRKIARTELKWREAYLQYWNESDDDDFVNIEGDLWCNGEWHFLWRFVKETDKAPVSCITCECEE